MNLIEYKIQDEIGFVQLNRPEVYNALIPELIHELSQILQSFDESPLVRVIILGGNGNSFCAGADIAWMKASADASEEQNLKDSRLLADLFQKIHTCSKPIIGAAQGPIFGGGIGLMAACDIVVAEESARFKFSEVRLGITPSTIMPHIVRRIGKQHAKVKIFTAQLFDAKQAYKMGLVDYLVKNELHYFAKSVAKDIIKGSPEAIIETKKLLDFITSNVNAEELIEESVQSLARIKKSKNATEGLASFVEKRKPVWSK